MVVIVDDREGVWVIGFFIIWGFLFIISVCCVLFFFRWVIYLFVVIFYRWVFEYICNIVSFVVV